MFHYLFTNDLRITRLNEALEEAGTCFKNDSVPSATEDKNANNNINTLGFYFNLTKESNCSIAASNGEIRRVVLNFIKKFQFPNPRTSASYNDAINDGISIAPMRLILQTLYMMGMMDPENAYLSRGEIADYIFFNEDIAKTTKPDTAGLARRILEERTDAEPKDVDADGVLNARGCYWKQCKRQIREMVKTLVWAGCVVENEDSCIRIRHNELSRDNEADIFEIITYFGFWNVGKETDFNKIKESYQKYMDIEYIEEARGEKASKLDILTPEWFKEKADSLKGFDEKAQPLYEEFCRKYAPDKLALLEGKDILTTIFLNPYNKTNMCYEMEYDKQNRYYFGSIKSGTAYKYGLHYSKANNSWVAGTQQNHEFISEEEAVELGAEIRDYLVKGAEVFEKYLIDGGNDFLSIYEELISVTDGNINKIWFLKYYHLMFPEVYPPIYSAIAQNTSLEVIGKTAKDNTPFSRLKELEDFVKECEISNVLFNHIMWFYAVNENAEAEEEKEEMKSCLEIVKKPRSNKVHPVNFIVYGAPGTGKTYSMAEYALAIIDNITIEEFRANNKDREKVIKRYKEYIKLGQVVFTTFHQNYGYEEFIQGLRPDRDSDTLSFEVVDGVFKSIADRALNDEENKNYVIIIDEINRANISKVFGELITLVEEDKRWGELNETCATLQSGDVFAVPNNLYIVGTMNSADKSISLIDAALRRRFDFIEQRPEVSLIKNEMLRKFLEQLNETLVEELDSTDLLVGHSYFMNKDEADLCTILNNNIIPLLYEYFYDNRKKVASILVKTIKDVGAHVVLVDEKVGRLSVKDE